MAANWKDISESNEYRSLSVADKDAVRADFFARVIAPTLATDDIDTVRSDFMARTAPGVFDRVRDVLPEAIGGLKEDIPVTPPKKPPAVDPDVALMNQVRSEMPGASDAAVAAEMTRRVAKPAPAAPVAPRRSGGASGSWDAPKATGQSLLIPATVLRDKSPKPNMDILAKQGFRASGEDLMRRQAIHDRNNIMRRTGASEVTARAMQNQQAISGKPVNPGSITESDFDFDKASDYKDRSAIARGAAKGGNLLVKQVLGLHEAAADLAGAEDYADWTRQQRERFDRSDEAIGERGDYLTKSWENAVTSMVSTGPGLLLGLVSGGSIPLVMMGAQVFGDEYSQGKAAGLGKDDAAKRAGIFGVAEIIGERLGMPSFIKFFKTATQGVPTDELVKALGAHVAREVPGEQLTTALQFGTDKFAEFGLHQDATLEDYIEQARDTLVQTVMQAGAMGATGAAINYPRARAQTREQNAADQAEQSAQAAFNRYFGGFGGTGGLDTRADNTVATDVAERLDAAISQQLSNPDPEAMAAAARDLDTVIREDLAAELSDIGMGLAPARVETVPLPGEDLTIEASELLDPEEQAIIDEVRSELASQQASGPDSPIVEGGDPATTTTTGTLAGQDDGAFYSEPGAVDAPVAEPATIEESTVAQLDATTETTPATPLPESAPAPVTTQSEAVDYGEPTTYNSAARAAANLTNKGFPTFVYRHPDGNGFVIHSEAKGQSLGLVRADLSDEARALKGVSFNGNQTVRTGAGAQTAPSTEASAAVPAMDSPRTEQPEAVGQGAGTPAAGVPVPAAKKKASASNNLLTRIKQLGGINVRYRSDVLSDNKGGPVGLFSNSGNGLDDLATMLQAEGFDINIDDVDGGVGALTELIQESISGRTVLNFQGQEDARAAEDRANYRAALMEEIQELGGKAAKNAPTAKLEEIRAKLQQDVGLKGQLDAGRLKNVISDELTAEEWAMLMDAPGAELFILETDLAIIQAEQQEREDADAVEARYREEGQGYTGQVPARGSQEDRATGGAEPGNRATQEGREELSLTGQTPEQVKAEEEAAEAARLAKEAEAKKAEDDARKARIAAEVASRQKASAANFQLGQSAEDAIAGQGDIFSQPAMKAEGKPVSANTVFTEDAAEKARALLKRKLGQLNTGIDPEIMQAGITLAGYHIEKGARTFAAYAKAMTEDLGDVVKPYLKSWYMGVKFDPRAAGFDGMDSAASVEAVDVDKAGEQKAETVDKAVQEATTSQNDDTPEQSQYEQWWDKELTVFGRRRVLEAAGVNAPDSVQWHRLSEDKQEKLIANRAAADKPESTSEPAPQQPAFKPHIQDGQYITDEPETTYETKKGKTLRGVIAKGLSVDQAKSVDKFTWKRDGGYFIRIEYVQRPSATMNQEAPKNDEQPRTTESTRPQAGNDQANRGDGRDSQPGSRPMGSGVGEARPQDGSGRDATGGGAQTGGTGTGSGGIRAAEQLDGGDRGPSTVRDRPERPATGLAEQTPKAPSDEGVSLSVEPKADFVIDSETADAISEGGQRTKARKNIAAIKLAKKIDGEGRRATIAEQKTLAQYVGWGGIKQIFDDSKADWAALRDELKSVMTQAEYEAARRSMLDAHYTSPDVVTGMWEAAAHLGFKGGRVLEPSMGIGNFFGLMPASVRANSTLFGVELDNITGMIGKNLYPNATVATPMGYQDVELPTGSFDFATGNPPFGDQSLYDKNHPDLRNFSIHQFFFAKTLDKLRPGGIMQMVVSRYLMDSVDGAGFAARRHLGQRAKLLGAIRLPYNAFLGNANTEVVTDIIFLQKLQDGETGNIGDWEDSGQVTGRNKQGDEFTFNINRYFVNHPEMVVGSHAATGKMRQANQYNVEPNRDIPLIDGIRAAVKNLPEGVYVAAGKPLAELMTADAIVPEGTKIYGYFMAGDKVMQRVPDSMGTRQAVPVEFKDKAAPKRAARMIGLRDTLRELMRAELSESASDAEIKVLRDRLNSEYAEFKSMYGFLNQQVNRRAFRDDPDLPLLESLEPGYQEPVNEWTGAYRTVNHKDGTTSEAKVMREVEPRKSGMADIFSKRVLSPFSQTRSVTSAKDALIASLNERGRIDTDHMVELYGKPWEDIETELGDLIYLDPSGAYETADAYLSGNVKAKLKHAEEAAKTNPKHERNVSALKDVQPADMPAMKISVRLGSPWVPSDVMGQFASELWGTKNPSIRYVQQAAKWSVNASGGDETARTATWGTSRLDAQEILAHILNNKPIVIKDNHGTSKEPNWVVNESETEAAKAKSQEMSAKFKEWIWDDENRRVRLERIYNDTYNTDRRRQYDGSHATMPGSSPVIQFKRHQKDAVWRAIQDRSILLDHVVGAGKTFVMTAIAMEMRRIGLSRKPMFIVPNSLVRQWRDEFYKLYPNANVLAATEDDFSKKNRKRFMAKIATGDWDAVIVAHSSFKKIGMPIEAEREILNEQLTEIVEAIEEMKRERGDRHIVRDMERTKEKLKEKLKALSDRAGKKDDTVTFDELGVDSIFLDEAHLYKNLFYVSGMRNVAGLGSPSGSGRAFDLFAKVRYLNKRYSGKAPIVFATGTPVSNSLVEMYTMQRYLAWDKLKDRGLHMLDAWAGVYGDVQQVYEVHPSGTGYRLSTRFAKFVNLPSLMDLYRGFADVITLDDLKRQAKEAGGVFPVPRLDGGKPDNIVAERSELQTAFFGKPEFARDEEGNIRFELNEAPQSYSVELNNKTGKYYIAGGDKHYALTAKQYENPDEATEDMHRAIQTPVIQWNKDSILWKFENLKALTKESKGKINALSVTNQARKAGLDYRLIDPSAPDFKGSKINLAVKEIKRIYNKWAADKGTQLVFCDLSVPASARAAAAKNERPSFIRDADGQLKKVKATAVLFDDYEGLAFLAVKHGSGADGGYVIYDGLTGVHTGFADHSKAAAVAELRAKLDSDGTAWLEEKRAGRAEIDDAEIADWKDENEKDGTEADTEEDGELSVGELMSMAGNGKFSVYDDLKAKLIAEGVPEKEIAFIHDYDTAVKKAKLFEKVRAGDVRILIGSTEKMGAGMNVQERLVGLHHLDAPWRPSDLEQREGRIIRQGNELYKRDPDGFEIEIKRYGTRQTYDTRMWQIIEHKASGVEQLRKAGADMLEIDDIGGEAANSADMKAAASGNPLILEEIKLRNEVKSLEAQQYGYQDAKIAMQDKVRRYRKAPGEAKAKIEAVQPFIDARDANPPKPFSYKRGSKTFNDLKDATTPVTEAFVLGAKSLLGEQTNAGVYRGLPITLRKIPSGVEVAVSSGDESLWVTTYTVDDKFSPQGFFTRIDNALEKLTDRVKYIQEDADTKTAEIPKLESEIAKPFAKETELKAARAKHREIVSKLAKSGGGIELTPEMQAELKVALVARQIRGATNLSRRSISEDSDTIIHHEDLAAVIKQARAAFPGLQINVVDEERQLPRGLREFISENDASGDVAGAYHDGEVYLVRNGLSGVTHAEDTVLHEATHAGLARLFGDQIGPVMLDINRSNMSLSAKAAKLKVKYGYSLTRATEEALADMGAEVTKLKGWSKLVAWVRDQLRKIGAVKTWTDADVEALVLRALKSAKKPKSTIYRGSALSQADDGFVTDVLRELADHDELFRYPVSSKTSIDGVMAEVLPDAIYLGEDTRHDEREESQADRRYVFKTKGGTPFYVYERGEGEVWIDVSRLLEGSRGGAIYAAVANYAHNTGKVFIGDPNGLSEAAAVRRTSHMLSSALRFGTTRHIAPSQEQLSGNADTGRAPLDWSGNDVDKIESLVHTFLKTTYSQFPALKNYRYDFGSRQFIDGQGRPIGPDRFADAAAIDSARASRSGEATLRRALFLKSLVSSARGERPGILEQVLSRGRQLVTNGGIAAMFSRASQTPPRGGVSASGSLPGVPTVPPTVPPVQQSATLQGGAPGNPNSWDAPEASKLDDYIYILQDKHIDLKRAIEGIKAAGRVVQDKWNAYMQEELFHGRTAKRTQDFVDRELIPLLKEMKLRELSLDDLDKYLWARHAKEANELIRQRDASMQDGGSGMTDAEADAYFAGLDPAKRRRLEAVAAKVDDMIARTRELYVSYGLENRDTVDGWAAMFQHYVPLMREDHDGGMGIGQGFSIKGKEVKHRTGSTANVVDILANIAMQREKVIVRGEKNRVAVSLAGLVKLNPAPDFWSLDKLPTERVFNEASGQVETRVIPNYRTRDNVIIAKIKDAKGQVQERAIVLNEKDDRAVRLATAMKNLDAAQLEGWMGVSASITRYFAAINTQYNPVFGVVNLIRDVQSAILNLSSTPLKGHRAEIAKHTLSALRGIYVDQRAERKGGAGSSQWALLWEEFTNEGGQTGYRDLFRTSNDRADAIRRELDPAWWTKTKAGKIVTVGGVAAKPMAWASKKAETLIFDWLSDYNLAMENAVRLAAYKVAIEQGMSKQQAASLGKNLTVNFNRKGQTARQVGALYAFFNAAMQGTARIADTMIDRDAKTGEYSLSSAGKKIAAGGVLLGVIQALALAAAGFDDDEPPEFIRERNLVIPIGDGKYVAIPMPLGFHVLPNIGRIPTEYALGGFERGTRHVIDLIGIMAEAFNPLGSAGLSMQTIAPTIIDPFAALAENRDWTGKPIAKEDFSSLAPTPGHMRAKDMASAPSRLIAEGINFLSGGTEFTPGAVSPTPDQIDYLFGQLTGGVGRETSKLWQSTEAMVTGQELPPHKIPLVGRLYGNTESQAAVAGRFYNNLKKVNRHKAEFEGRISMRDAVGAWEYQRNNPETALRKLADMTERDIRKLQAEKRRLVAAGNREQVKRIEELIERRMRNFNERVKSVEERAR